MQTTEVNLLVAQTPVVESKKQDDEEKGKQKRNQRDLLLDLTEELDLWSDDDGIGYATVPRKMTNAQGDTSSWFENYPLKSTAFRNFLTGRFYQKYFAGCGAQALTDAILTLQAKALAEGRKFQPSIRVTGTRENLFIDLGDEHWRSIEVTRSGWQYTQPPIRFIRTKGMAPLVVPFPEGSVEDLNKLRSLLGLDGINNDSIWTLLLGWVIGALMPAGPYPALVLVGPQGSGKSTCAKVFRRLLDPSTVELRSLPKDERDLFLAAKNNRLLVFDNLSGLSKPMSDAMCKIATGGGYATRALYTDEEESVFSVIRPIVINGIDDLTTRHDLAQRSILINLPEISEEHRVPESEFWDQFEGIRPRVFGALLHAISVAMRNYEQARKSIPKLPRMADFSIWATAAEEALGLSKGAFLSAYTINRQEIAELGTETPLVEALRCLLLARNPATGTPMDLLKDLQRQAGDQAQLLPKLPSVLSNELRRMAPELRRIGITVDSTRSNGRRWIRIEQRPDQQLNVQEVSS